MFYLISSNSNRVANPVSGILGETLIRSSWLSYMTFFFFVRTCISDSFLGWVVDVQTRLMHMTMRSFPCFSTHMRKRTDQCCDMMIIIIYKCIFATISTNSGRNGGRYVVSTSQNRSARPPDFSCVQWKSREGLGTRLSTNHTADHFKLLPHGTYM